MDPPSLQCNSGYASPNPEKELQVERVLSLDRLLKSAKQLGSENNFSCYIQKHIGLHAWRRICFHSEQSTGQLKCFVELCLEEEPDEVVIKILLQTCGQQLSRFLLYQGSPQALTFLLQYARKFELWDTCFAANHIPHSNLPMNGSVYYGRWRNVDLLLSYGFNVEYTYYFYEILLRDVIKEIVTSQQTECFEQFKKDPNRKRRFLTLLVIRTYLFESRFPYYGCGASLRSIWQYLPDSYLSREEFLKVFGTFEVRANRLKEVYDRYVNVVCDGDPDLHLKPRTLAHHSRCKVRKMMRESFALPDHVDKLFIPTVLKDYLLYR